MLIRLSVYTGLYAPLLLACNGVAVFTTKGLDLHTRRKKHTSSIILMHSDYVIIVHIKRDAVSTIVYVVFLFRLDTVYDVCSHQLLLSDLRTNIKHLLKGDSNPDD